MNLERSASLIGGKNINRLYEKTVMVVGVGGVGSFCVEALARSGIGHLILIDKDVVESSNINRQLIALTDTIGQNKVDVLKERIHRINPNCKVDTYRMFYDRSQNEMIFQESIDFVIDCIDSIQSKMDLIEACLDRKIPFFSSMGTARRMDPTRLKIMELEKTSYDPIARRLRTWKRKQKIRQKIWVVSSDEPAIPVQKDQPLPSMIFVPATAGIILANACVQKLIK